MKVWRSAKGFIQQSISAVGQPFVAATPGILPPISRSTFKRRIPRPVLEIGPCGRPFLTGEGVEYFDIYTQAEQRERALAYGHEPDDCPFIHHTGSLGKITSRFAAVFSSHAIEHTPDLIAHLHQVRTLLRDGGAYFLIVPDRRYCFDHFVRGTLLEDVYAGIGRDRPTMAAVQNHYMRHTHNNPGLHWIGIHGSYRAKNSEFMAASAAHASGEYVDVHQWAFTPQSFREIVSALGIFSEVRVHDTAFATLEFMAILKP